MQYKMDEIIRKITETNEILKEMEKRLPAKPRFEREVEAVKKLSRIRIWIHSVRSDPMTSKEVMDKILSML